jgi:hypothetical protein
MKIRIAERGDRADIRQCEECRESGKDGIFLTLGFFNGFVCKDCGIRLLLSLDEILADPDATYLAPQESGAATGVVESSKLFEMKYPGFSAQESWEPTKLVARDEKIEYRPEQFRYTGAVREGTASETFKSKPFEPMEPFYAGDRIPAESIRDLMLAPLCRCGQLGKHQETAECHPTFETDGRGLPIRNPALDTPPSDSQPHTATFSLEPLSSLDSRVTTLEIDKDSIWQNIESLQIQMAELRRLLDSGLPQSISRAWSLTEEVLKSK